MIRRNHAKMTSELASSPEASYMLGSVFRQGSYFSDQDGAELQEKSAMSEQLISDQICVLKADLLNGERRKMDTAADNTRNRKTNRPQKRLIVYPVPEAPEHSKQPRSPSLSSQSASSSYFASPGTEAVLPIPPDDLRIIGGSNKRKAIRPRKLEESPSLADVVQESPSSTRSSASPSLATSPVAPVGMPEVFYVQLPVHLLPPHPQPESAPAISVDLAEMSRARGGNYRAIRARERRMTETPDQREERLAKQRERTRLLRQQADAISLAQRRAVNAEAKRRRRMTESDEERRARQAYQAAVKRERRLVETEEQRRARQAREAEVQRIRRATETPEQRKARQARQAEVKRLRRLNETDEQRRARQDREAEVQRQRRSMLKTVTEAQSGTPLVKSEVDP